MYVCLCHGVSDGELKDVIRAGADTSEKVGAVCGAGTCCCGCCKMIQDMIDEHRPEPVNVADARPQPVDQLRQVS